MTRRASGAIGVRCWDRCSRMWNGRSSWLATTEQLVGYGWVRPDGERLGPLIADTPEIATALVGEAFERLPSTDALSLNLPPDNRDGAVRLAELGAELEQWDGRMGRGPQVPRRDDTVYGMVVGALG